MADLEKLVVALEARTAAFEKAMNRAHGVSEKRVRQIDARWKKLNLGANAFAGFAKGAVAGILPLLTLGAAINKTKQALDDFSAVADRAAAAGLDPELYQSLEHQLGQVGVEAGQSASAFAAFAKSSGQAEVGTGRMAAALKKLDPELLKAIQGSETQAERVRIAADALAKIEDPARRAAVAVALFGESGNRIAEGFKGGSAAIDEMLEKGKQLGIVVDREMIERADTLGDELAVASKIVDQQLAAAFVDAAPSLVYLVGLAGDLAKALNITVDQFRAIEDRQFLKPLQNQLANLHNARFAMIDEVKKLEDALAQGDMIPDFIQEHALASARAEVERMTAEAMRLLDRITELQGRGAPLDLPPEREAPVDTDTAFGDIEIATKLTKEHQQAVEEDTEAMQLLGQIGRQAIDGIVDALADGKLEAQEFSNIISDLLRTAGSFFLDAAFGGGGGNPLSFLFGGGGIGGMSPAGRVKFRAGGGPVAAGQPYVVGEHRPELFVPSQNGFIVPRVPDMARGGSPGGGGLTVNTTINIAGNADAMTMRQLRDWQRFELPAAIEKHMRDPHAVG